MSASVSGADDGGATRPRDGSWRNCLRRAQSCREVARRHDISPQHLFAWRKAARAGLLSLPADDAPMFIPVVTEHRQDGVTTTTPAREGITIEIGGVVVRAAHGIDLVWLRDVLRAVKAAT